MGSNILSGDQLNFTRMGIASVDEIPVVLADILRCEIKPEDLQRTINSCSELVTGRHKLRSEQLRICCLSPPAIPDYNKFDVSLLYKLLRNLCPQLKPTQDWGKPPFITDIQIGDDIERLREFRNEMFAHLESSKVEDLVFTSQWQNLEQIFQRIQRYLKSKKHTVDYEKKLASIAKIDFGFKDMEKYRLLLEGMMRLLRDKDDNDVPAISILGNAEVLCGEKACFEAILDKCSSSNNWPITWEKIQGNITKQLDTSEEKYTGSSSRRLVIPRVVKEDEGEYRAVISRENNGSHTKIPSNLILLTVKGELPYVGKLTVSSERNEVKIHCNFRVDDNSPNVEKVLWKKNGEVLTPKPRILVCESQTESQLSINLATDEDSGEYACEVINAVGPSRQCIALGIPAVTITKELSVPFGSPAVFKADIQACPPAESILWQKSKLIDPKAEHFQTIDINSSKYSGSTLDPTNPRLAISQTTFEDRLFYRLLVSNGIGKSVSGSAYLSVTGSPPNVFTVHETNFQEKSVILICNVHCENFQLKELVWSKDNEYIYMTGNKAKYSGGGKDNPSLKINAVNTTDAGIYQCRASNVVGSTLSEPITLGPPNITLFIGRNNLDKDTLKIQASIKSIPDAFKVEWKIQRHSGDEFHPIDLHEEAYKGSTVSLPYPLLVVHKYNSINIYKVEVTNFIGVHCVTSQEVIEENQLTVDRENKCMKGANFAIYKDKGAKIRFDKFRCSLIDEISESEMITLKYSLGEILSEDIESFSSAKNVTEFINLLRQQKVFTDRDVIIMQYLMRAIKRTDLEKKCIDYATSSKERLCYFQEEKHADGTKRVKLHVADDIENFTRLDSLIETVAAIVECDPKSIEVVGILRESSFIIVIRITGKLAQLLLRKTRNVKEMVKLTDFNVDRIEVDGVVINIKQPGSIKSEKHDKELGYCEEMESCFKKKESPAEHLKGSLMNYGEYEMEFGEKEKKEGSITDYEVYDMAFEKMESQLKKEESRVGNLKGSRTDYGGYEMEFGQMEKMENQFKTRESREGKLKGSRVDYGGYEMEFGKKEKMEDQFQKRESRKGKLKDVSLSKYLSPTVVSTFSITVPELDSICHISFVTSDNLWVSGHKRLLQVDSSGQIIQKKKIEIGMCLNTEGGFHTVTEDGELLFIDSFDRVQKMTLGGTITTLIKQEQALLCIHSSSINGDILLGCRDGVMRYDRRGQLRIWDAMRVWIRKIHYPIYITENRNGDICFCDRHKNAVVVMDKLGRLRFKYRGQSSQSDFDPHGICTDILGQVLVCDAYRDNPSVHLLDQDGQFLRLLLTRKHGLRLPWALCLDDKHNLYLGEMFSNSITAYNYPQKIEKSANYNDYEMQFGKEEKTEGQFIKKESRVGELKDVSLSHYLSPTVVSTSSITISKLDSINHISFMTSDKLWVSDYKRLLQVDSSGHKIVKKRMETDIHLDTGFHTVTEDGELLFINRENGVQKITSDGTITTLIKTERRLLRCIHSSRINGDILVGCLGEVLRYDRKGQLIGEAIEEWIRWIRYPIYITENKNGDIWVSDEEEVVVVDKSGRHRFDYTGQQSQSYFGYGFKPRGICTDILGQVLVCDYYNRSVHLLDQDGQFLCLLLTRKHGLRSPTALCVDDKHNLYLGQRNSNTIKVYRYLKETGDKNTSSELDVSKTKAVFKYLQETEKKNTSLMESK